MTRLYCCSHPVCDNGVVKPLWILLLLALPLAAQRPPAAQKRIAVTIDDLPWVERDGSTARALEGTRVLLDTLKAHGVPAVGFVNANKIEERADGPEWSAMLKQWMDGGLDLGNHTYSHRDLNGLSPAEYQQEVILGETPWRAWMDRLRPASRLYFRHPFTHTGGDKGKREAFESFLTGRGYRVAPFTIENSDYLFDWVRWKVESRGDRELASKVQAAYAEHHTAMMNYFEQLSRAYFDRDVAQILLIHTNEINRRMLGELLTTIEQRGYRFVTLDEALRDPAYATADLYVGKGGPSWLHRWGIALGKEMDLRNEPDPPAWFLDLNRKLQAEAK